MNGKKTFKRLSNSPDFKKAKFHVDSRTHKLSVDLAEMNQEEYDKAKGILEAMEFKVTLNTASKRWPQAQKSISDNYDDMTEKEKKAADLHWFQMGGHLSTERMTELGLQV